MLGKLDIVELRTEHLHSQFSVCQLRTSLLTNYNNTCRLVGQLDLRLDLIDVLPAGTT